MRSAAGVSPYVSVGSRSRRVARTSSATFTRKIGNTPYLLVAGSHQYLKAEWRSTFTG